MFKAKQFYTLQITTKFVKATLFDPTIYNIKTFNFAFVFV